VAGLPIDNALKYESGLSSNTKPMWIFLIALVGLTFWSFSENLSLIPLGLVLYMMAELSVWNWIYFTIWLLIGLIYLLWPQE
jgi:chromate transport protein ChrA